MVGLALIDRAAIAALTAHAPEHHRHIGAKGARGEDSQAG